jgi:RNA 3'-terminal phosphate cyclase
VGAPLVPATRHPPPSTSGKTGGNSPGFALLLTAETTAGATVGAERAASVGALPEDVANAAVAALLEEVCWA